MTGVLATTRVAVYRGTTLNAIGDEVDSTTPVAGLLDVPIAITERSRKVFTQESDEVRTVRYVVGRIQNGKTDIRKDDRLYDNRTGRGYYVDEVTGGERTIAGTSPLQLDLRKV